ncbi:putative leucine-rich repeat-containing protein DDB_G0290503 isoform X2 [Mercenaria mercenaria]|uniref:putative leucine-rich repeat-containing protein DDB_G0290503 isoform X2 n=1 Tax=Mercenaria mercenaria TaxID=6596 RepID=UPI00234EEEF3|nr:putative leucine-rich repeat-containing protein DDB_G0290503 isoform X2 [Mercenaria mercenaria]
MVLASMDIKRMRSVLVCVTCIVFMPGYAYELDSDVVFEIFSRLDKVMKEQRELRHSLDVAVGNMIHQADIDEISNKMEKQADKIVMLEEAINMVEKQADRITNLGETTNRIEKKVDNKISSLEKANNKIKRQADRISKLEETVKNKANGVASIENEVQKQNNRIAKLENSTLNNENSYDEKLSNFTNEVKLQMSSLNASQISSFDMILKVTEKTLSVALTDYSSYMNDTFLNLKQEIVTSANETERKLKTLQGKTDHYRKTLNDANGAIQQLKTKIVNVESRQETLQKKVDKETDHCTKTLKTTNGEIQQLGTRMVNVETRQAMLKEKSDIHTKTLNTNNGKIQQLKTRIGKVQSRQETLQEKVNKISDNYTKTLKTTNGEIQQLETRMVNVETRQETLQEKVDKISDHHTKTLKTTNGEIQQLETRMVNVETRQGKRTAFTVYDASRQTSGILNFTKVKLNEGYVFDTTTGQFTSPYAGVYGFTASIIETGSGDNYIHCRIRKNGSDYVHVISRQGVIDDERVTDGRVAATGTATLRLAKKDSVDVWCHNRTGINLGWSSFSGFLITPDP